MRTQSESQAPFHQRRTRFILHVAELLSLTPFYVSLTYYVNSTDRRVELNPRLCCFYLFVGECIPGRYRQRWQHHKSSAKSGGHRRGTRNGKGKSASLRLLSPWNCSLSSIHQCHGLRFILEYQVDGRMSRKTPRSTPCLSFITTNRTSLSCFYYVFHGSADDGGRPHQEVCFTVLSEKGGWWWWWVTTPNQTKPNPGTVARLEDVIELSYAVVWGSLEEVFCVIMILLF